MGAKRRVKVHKETLASPFSVPRDGETIKTDDRVGPAERCINAPPRSRQQSIPPNVFRTGEDNGVRDEVLRFDERMRREVQEQVQRCNAGLRSAHQVFSIAVSSAMNSQHVARSIES